MEIKLYTCKFGCGSSSTRACEVRKHMKQVRCHLGTLLSSEERAQKISEFETEAAKPKPTCSHCGLVTDTKKSLSNHIRHCPALKKPENLTATAASAQKGNNALPRKRGRPAFSETEKEIKRKAKEEEKKAA